MKTHFRKAANSPYLGSQDLPDYKDIILTIKEVKLEQTKGLKENDTMNIAHFVEGVKPMLLNSTNSKTIKALAKSNFLEDWSGLKIQIYVQQNVKAFGELHDALRIRPTVPVTKKPSITKDSKNYADLVKKIKEGLTVDKIRKHYEITDDLFNTMKTSK